MLGAGGIRLDGSRSFLGWSFLRITVVSWWLWVLVGLYNVSCRERSVLSSKSVVVTIGYAFVVEFYGCCSGRWNRAFECLGTVADAIINSNWIGDMACRQTLEVS